MLVIYISKVLLDFKFRVKQNQEVTCKSERILLVIAKYYAKYMTVFIIRDGHLHAVPGSN